MDSHATGNSGLPVGKSLVESLIKQINHRVKAPSNSGNDGGLEAVLQVRAATGQDDRAESFTSAAPRLSRRSQPVPPRLSPPWHRK